jgi:hypothetical protein
VDPWPSPNIGCIRDKAAEADLCHHQKQTLNCASRVLLPGQTIVFNGKWVPATFRAIAMTSWVKVGHGNHAALELVSEKRKTLSGARFLFLVS